MNPPETQTVAVMFQVAVMFVSWNYGKLNEETSEMMEGSDHHISVGAWVAPEYAIFWGTVETMTLLPLPIHLLSHEILQDNENLSSGFQCLLHTCLCFSNKSHNQE